MYRKLHPVLSPFPGGPKEGYLWVKSSNTKAAHSNVCTKAKQYNIKEIKPPVKMVLKVRIYTRNLTLIV